MKFTFFVASLILSASLVSSQNRLPTTIRQIRPRCGTCNPTCFRRRSNAGAACAPTNSCRLALNCSVRRCARPNDSRTPFGFQCTGTIPPPTTLPPVTLLPAMTAPNTCPNICTLDVNLVVSQCSQPGNQAIGCIIQQCDLPGSQGLECAQQTAVTSSTMGAASSAPTASASPSISSTPSATASVSAAASISATVTPSPSASPSISISPSPSQNCDLTAQGSAGTNIVCRCGSESSSVTIPLGTVSRPPSPSPSSCPWPPCAPAASPAPSPTIPACYNNCLISGLGLLCRPSAFGGFSSSARGAAEGCCTQCSGSLSGSRCIFS